MEDNSKRVVNRKRFCFTFILQTQRKKIVKLNGAWQGADSIKFFFFLLLDAARKFFKISVLFCFVNSKDPRASSATKLKKKIGMPGLDFVSLRWHYAWWKETRPQKITLEDCKGEEKKDETKKIGNKPIKEKKHRNRVFGKWSASSRFLYVHLLTKAVERKPDRHAFRLLPFVK